METNAMRTLVQYVTLTRKLDSGWASTPARYRAAVDALGTLHRALQYDAGELAGWGLHGAARACRARSEDCRSRLARF